MPVATVTTLNSFGESLSSHHEVPMTAVRTADQTDWTSDAREAAGASSEWPREKPKGTHSPQVEVDIV